MQITQNKNAAVEESHSAFLSGLNGEQKEAVETTEGPLLVLAGAGTGKTRVLTTRIAYILSQNLAFSSQILAVTFTNKAAREMKLRIEKMVGPEAASGIWLGTFHSIALRILRRHADKAGLSSDFAVIDTDDQIRLIKQLMEENHIDDKKFPPKAAAAIIQRWKDRALNPKKATAMNEDSVAAKLYESYQRRLLTLSAVDFGDLLLHCIELFMNNSDILAEYHRRFRYLMVDEYQDTNIAQYLWLRLLAQGSQNLCCVGDDDQSIYGWRGAEVENILRFSKDFEGAKTIRLERNYRSTPQILASASAVIANNKDRLGKTLFSDHGEGEKIKLVSTWDERAEAQYIGQEIEALQKIKSLPLNNVAVLVRAGFQTRSFEECFISMGLPYRVLGGLRFYERMEIRDALAYIRAAAQPANDLALERIINTPKRGIGNSTLDSLREHARLAGISLQAAIKEKIENNELRPKLRDSLSLLLTNIENWRTAFSSSPHRDVVERIMEESGYLQMWKSEKTPEAQGRVENLKELITAIEEFDDINHFLEHVSLITDADDSPESDMVSIMTMHGAKGLEFDAVFLTGWEEGLFPSQRSIDEKGNSGLEEERRLAYVGITRAKKYLTITFAANRRVYGQWLSAIPSRFIDELPAEYSENISYGPAYSSPQTKPELHKKYNIPTTPSLHSANNAKFSVRERIFHQKFGYGRILEISGKHLKIAFEKSSTRTLLEDYVKKV